MKYTADTGFFIRLSESHPKALEIWGSIRDGKGRLIIPAMVLAEMTRLLLMKGQSAALEKMITAIDFSSKCTVCDLTAGLAKDGGTLAQCYGVSAVDGTVLATAIATGHDVVLTSDTLFRRVGKDRKVTAIELLQDV
ncbi:type II toxin-antitoxin system VapC family toxin [Candidatus Woesearchaeota archaeon]|nr:type II toxin-antitoxin system VapC family toxin [Candidatus Woesearchaeota archaeon]